MPQEWPPNWDGKEVGRGSEIEGEEGGGKEEEEGEKDQLICTLRVPSGNLSISELLCQFWGLSLQGNGKFWQQQSRLGLLPAQLLKKAGN